jgi:purine nucleosidase
MINQKRFSVQKVSLMILCIILTTSVIAQKQQVWLDADTGNEMDDLYAIVRLVKDTTVEMVGLSSAHFNNPDLLVFEKWNAYDTEGLNSVAESQRLNEEILQALERQDIAHPQGADRQIGRAWGQQDPRDSPAARGIIAVATSLREGERLDVIAIGAVTNLATALILDPGIITKIRCYVLGAQYNPVTGIWNKNEFNVRNDLNAFDYLLNLEGLDLTVMSLETAFPLQFKREETYGLLNEKQAVEALLENRWREQNPQDASRVMWDLALLEAYLNPDLAKLETVVPPPENLQRPVKAFTKIDAVALAKDFWLMVKFPEKFPAEETLISNLHTLSIHIQDPALHDSVFRFLTEKLQLPIYYQPMVLGERLYGGVFAGNLVLEPCGPYSNIAYASRDFKAIFFGLTFEPAVSIPEAVRILRERKIDHETGGDEFIFFKDPVLCGDNTYISLMDKHDKMRDHVRLDSLRLFMEKGSPGLGIEYVKEIRIGIPDMENLTKWKTFIAPDSLNENLTWRIDDKLHFNFTLAPFKEISSITFKVKSIREAENFLNENKVLFTSEPGLIRIDSTQSFGLLIFLK